MGNKLQFYKFQCGCVGIPLDETDMEKKEPFKALVFQICDQHDDQDIMLTVREISYSKYGPQKKLIDLPEELFRKINILINDGYGMKEVRRALGIPAGK